MNQTTLNETKVATDTKVTKDSSAPFPKRTYYMLYRTGNSGAIQKFFEFCGNLRDATLRAKAHCGTMEFVFLMCRPHIVDLDHQEACKLKDPSFSEGVETDESYRMYVQGAK